MTDCQLGSVALHPLCGMLSELRAAQSNHTGRWERARRRRQWAALSSPPRPASPWHCASTAAQPIPRGTALVHVCQHWLVWWHTAEEGAARDPASP
eukprot:scaffold179587_cov29-Tisochrysis_lutea.AAC.4